MEKDFLNYQFASTTGKLLRKKARWRDDLAEDLPCNLLSKQEAESLFESNIEGEVLFSRIYIISPESDVFPVDPTPRNPCWVVRSLEDGSTLVTIIDAVTGEFLGHGLPPPYDGFSLSGAWCWDPCGGAWTSWYKNASYWFNTMGFSTDAVQWPTEEEVKNHIQSPSIRVFYELAHGGSTSFCGGCAGGESCEATTANEIETWLLPYPKVSFAFIGSCGGMCSTGDGTLSYEFRKGSVEDTATVGYCGMGGEHCSNCWDYSVGWQSALFNYMHQGYVVKEAFDRAMADYPMCASDPSCMRFAGDESFTPVPVGAEFVGSPIRGKKPLSVQFMDESGGGPTTWLWHFGDGQTSNEQNPSHTYGDVGKYAVTLEVFGNSTSDTETKSGYIHVLGNSAIPWELLLR